MRKNSFIAVAISRQMGSGGSCIGYLAAKERELRYLDREILRQAANKSLPPAEPEA